MGATQRVPLRKLVLLLALASHVSTAPLGREPKRRGLGSAVQHVGSSVLNLASKLLNLYSPPDVYHMSNPASRIAMIDKLWTGEYLSAAGRFTAANPELVSVFSQQGLDGAEAPRFRDRASTVPRFEPVLNALFRARSQNFVPLETAALTLAFVHYQVPHAAWDAMAYFTKAVMSRNWAETLCDEAVVRDPGPPYQQAAGMTAAVFDNFMMNIGYGSYSTKGQAGYQLQMTNWATAVLPAAAVPPHFDIDTMVRDGGIFRVDRALSDFLDLFSPINPELMANKRNRWVKYLGMAATNTIWDKEPFQSPYPPTWFHYHDPIFDRLQSSYEDVLFELNLIRRSRFHCWSDCVQIGGDGLSYMHLHLTLT